MKGALLKGGHCGACQKFLLLTSGAWSMVWCPLPQFRGVEMLRIEWGLSASEMTVALCLYLRWLWALLGTWGLSQGSCAHQRPPGGVRRSAPEGRGGEGRGWGSKIRALWGRFRTAQAQRGHSAHYHVVHPGNTPANHPPTEACTIHSTQHRGCGIQDLGTRGYRWWQTADFSHSARTAHGAPSLSRS